MARQHPRRRAGRSGSGLALIPEAIAFSIIAGVDPKVGLYASFSHCRDHRHCRWTTRHDLGRHSATARADGDAGTDYGLEYLLVATVLAGLIQVLAGAVKLARRLMRFVSRSVMTGFVNALAILIFLAQLPELDRCAVAHLCHGRRGGLAIIYLLPHLTKAIPSPLICILVAHRPDAGPWS